MADGMAYLPAMSRLFGEVEQPTSQQPYQNPFGGNPQQLMQLLQSPAFQQQFQQAGINVDPGAARQSPFFPNSFMHAHPMLGRALSGGMANAAMTPEAPLVSGAGSGISRAFQGMMGGPEMMRQYQVRQMMAPMQGLGMTIPYQEFQRKQQLMDLLTQMEQDRSNQGQQHLDIQRQQEIDKARQGDEHLNAIAPRFNQLTGETWTYQPNRPQDMPQIGEQGLISPGAQGGGVGGWQSQQAAPQRIADVAGAKETPAQKEQREGAGKLSKAKADAGGFAPKAPGKQQDNSKFSKQYNDAETQYRNAMAQYDAALKAGTINKQSYDQLMSQALTALQMSKSNVDQARGDPGASARGEAQMKPGRDKNAVGGAIKGLGPMMNPMQGGQQGGQPQQAPPPTSFPEGPGIYGPDPSGTYWHWDGKQATPGPAPQQ